MDVAVLISLEGMKTGLTAYSKPYINQDRAFILELGHQFAAYGVFDGHGSNGHHVAEFVSSRFKKSIYEEFHSDRKLKKSACYLPTKGKLEDEEIFRFIHNLFAQVDLELSRAPVDIRHSGCTGSVAIRYNQRIYVGYIGDSKVATLQFRGKSPYCFMETPEHNPGSPREADRIKQTGSNISIINIPFFTKPISRIVEAGLSVSRAFGDLAARPHGVTAIPDLLKFDIVKEDVSTSRYSMVLVLASDGLWDTATHVDLIEHITNHVQPQQKVNRHIIHTSGSFWNELKN